MTVDVYVKAIDDAFIDDIDEIKEDTMVEIFLVHPQDSETIEQTKVLAKQFPGLFYCAPLSLRSLCDERCLAYFLDDADLLEGPLDKPLYIDANMLVPELMTQLIDGGYKGIILNAKELYEQIHDFFIAIGPSNVNAFDMAVLANASMDRIVLQSAYPQHGFEEIFESVKIISSSLFRPEESIIARATLHSLKLFGLK
jgi:hypothetical protein